MSKELVPLLALERCEIYLAQICALVHLNDEDGQAPLCKKGGADQEIYHLISEINRDIGLLKSTME